MKRKLLLLPGAVLLVALAAYLTLRYFLQKPGRLPELLPEIARNLEFELEKVRYSHTRSGVKKWELSTERARRIKGSESIELTGVKARIYADGSLKSDTAISAAGGSYRVGSGDMALNGDIVIANPDFEIRTSRLDYQEALELITAPAKLYLRSEKLEIEADRAEIDLPRAYLTMQGRVKARIRLEPAAGTPPAGLSQAPAPEPSAPPSSSDSQGLSVAPPVSPPIPAAVEKAAPPPPALLLPEKAPELKVIRGPAAIKGKRKTRPLVEIDKSRP